MFSGAVALSYEMHMGPILFEPFAQYLADVVGPRNSILELACGSGRLTRHLIPLTPNLVATDISDDMLNIASRLMSAQFELADASSLPYEDDRFEVVACAFGVMFFPDKQQAFHQARRVLVPGGKLIFDTWAYPGANPWAKVAGDAFDRQYGAVEETAPSPFSYAEPELIEHDLVESGFTDVSIERVTLPLIVETAEQYARATATGTPMAHRLRRVGVTDIEPFVSQFAKDLVNEFGDCPMQTEMTAVVVTATKPV